MTIKRYFSNNKMTIHAWTILYHVICRGVNATYSRRVWDTMSLTRVSSYLVRIGLNMLTKKVFVFWTLLLMRIFYFKFIRFLHKNCLSNDLMFCLLIIELSVLAPTFLHTSVTRWLEYFSIFGHSQKWNIVQ